MAGVIVPELERVRGASAGRLVPEGSTFHWLGARIGVAAASGAIASTPHLAGDRTRWDARPGADREGGTEQSHAVEAA